MVLCLQKRPSRLPKELTGSRDQDLRLAIFKASRYIRRTRWRSMNWRGQEVRLLTSLELVIASRPTSFSDNDGLSFNLDASEAPTLAAVDIVKDSNRS